MALVRRRRPLKHLFIPYNGKIADITHADTILHTLTLANGAGTGAIPGETRKIIALILSFERAAGAGIINAFPNEGANSANRDFLARWDFQIVIKDGTQRLQYSLDTAGDDWDVYCFGYIVET